MVIEKYKFIWKTFEEEMPKPHEIFLVRSSKETIRDAQWAFISDNNKMIYAHDLKWHHYVSKCKKWLWCYDTNIELVDDFQVYVGQFPQPAKKEQLCEQK